jgi:hypothetical protein
MRFTKKEKLEKSEKLGFGYVEEGKTIGRKTIKEKECLKIQEHWVSVCSDPGGSELEAQRFWSLEALSHTNRRTRRFRENSRRFRGL